MRMQPILGIRFLAFASLALAGCDALMLPVAPPEDAATPPLDAAEPLPPADAARPADLATPRDLAVPVEPPADAAMPRDLTPPDDALMLAPCARPITRWPVGQGSSLHFAAAPNELALAWAQ